MKKPIITYWTINTVLITRYFNFYENAKQYYQEHKTTKPIKHTVRYDNYLKIIKNHVFEDSSKMNLNSIYGKGFY